MRLFARFVHAALGEEQHLALGRLGRGGLGVSGAPVVVAVGRTVVLGGKGGGGQVETVEAQRVRPVVPEGDDVAVVARCHFHPGRLVRSPGHPGHPAGERRARGGALAGEGVSVGVEQAHVRLDGRGVRHREHVGEQFAGPGGLPHDAEVRHLHEHLRARAPALLARRPGLLGFQQDRAVAARAEHVVPTQRHGRGFVQLGGPGDLLLEHDLAGEAVKVQAVVQERARLGIEVAFLEGQPRLHGLVGRDELGAQVHLRGVARFQGKIAASGAELVDVVASEGDERRLGNEPHGLRPVSGQLVKSPLGNRVRADRHLVILVRFEAAFDFEHAVVPGAVDLQVRRRGRDVDPFLQGFRR